MRIERRFTKEGKSPYETIAFKTASSEIRNPDGSVVFEIDNIQVPADWSQVACDVLAQKYFRKAGVPAQLRLVAEDNVPSWLWRSVPDRDVEDPSGGTNSVGDTEGRLVFYRLAGGWT
jgi:ribonucleoside-diphosphate reductase alpha chain